MILLPEVKKNNWAEGYKETSQKENSEGIDNGVSIQRAALGPGQ